MPRIDKSIRVGSVDVAFKGSREVEGRNYIAGGDASNLLVADPCLSKDGLNACFFRKIGGRHGGSYSDMRGRLDERIAQ